MKKFAEGKVYRCQELKLIKIEGVKPWVYYEVQEFIEFNIRPRKKGN
jgi:hypothetical protein